MLFRSLLRQPHGFEGVDPVAVAGRIDHPAVAKLQYLRYVLFHVDPRLGVEPLPCGNKDEVADWDEVLWLDRDLVEDVHPTLKPASHLVQATVGRGIRKLSDLHDYDIGVEEVPILAGVSSRCKRLYSSGRGCINAARNLYVLLRNTRSPGPFHRSWVTTASSS